MVSTTELNVCSFDTNLILRWLLADNEAQASLVQDILHNPKLKKVDIADIVIAECVWVMQSVYKMNRAQIAEGLQIVLTHPKFMLNRSLFQAVLPLFLEKTQHSFVDLMLSQYATFNGGVLLTFDRQLAKSLEKVVLVV